MKVLLVNGSPHKNGCTYTALSEVAKALEQDGIETEIFHIGTKPVRGCIACGACRKLGHCVFTDDPANELSEKMQAADGHCHRFPGLLCGPQRCPVRSAGSCVLFRQWICL